MFQLFIDKLFHANSRQTKLGQIEFAKSLLFARIYLESFKDFNLYFFFPFSSFLFDKVVIPKAVLCAYA